MNKSLIQKFNEWYPQFLSALHGVGDVLMSLTQTVFVAFGVPTILALLLYVEQKRVQHGVAMFESDKSLAVFAAWALVLANLVLEFQTHYIEHQHGYERGRDSEWSLRTWLKNMAYRLGLGSEWQPRLLSPARRYQQLLNLVTFTILALALAGSMEPIMKATSGAWYVALWSIISESELHTITVWAGGFLFALAAVLTAQGLSRYVAIRTAEVVVRMKRDNERDNNHRTHESGSRRQTVTASSAHHKPQVASTVYQEPEPVTLEDMSAARGPDWLSLMEDEETAPDEEDTKPGVAAPANFRKSP